MDAGELAVIAYDAMPVEVLTPHDQGVVYGVLQMALRTLEVQHESLLTEADEEAAATMRTLVETQQELIAAKAERDGWRSEAGELQKRIDASNAELSRAYADRDLFRHERDQLRSQIDEMAASHGAQITELRERIAVAEMDPNTVFETPNATYLAEVDLYPPGSVKVARGTT